MKQTVSLVLINALVCAGLLLGLNIASGYVIKYRPLVGRLLAPQPTAETPVLEPGEAYADKPLDVALYNRWRLPNYANDRALAYAMFHEFEQLKSVYAPFVGWKRQPFQGKTITINTAGDRVHTPPASARHDGPVVRFFGASTLWGTGAVDNQTLPAEFNKIYPQATVYNHAESELNARQNLGRLANVYSLGGSADYVVFYVGPTNLTAGCKQSRPLLFNRQDQLRKYIQQASPQTQSPFYNIFLANTMELLQRLANKLKQPATHTAEAPALTANIQACAKQLYANLDMAKTLTESRGGRFIAILHPVAFYRSPRLDHLPITQDPQDEQQQRVRAFYDAVLAEQADHPYLHDFTRAFDNNDYILIDDVHTSARGNEIIARQLANLLGPTL